MVIPDICSLTLPDHTAGSGVEETVAAVLDAIECSVQAQVLGP